MSRSVPIALLCLCLLVDSSWGVGVMINEFSNGSGPVINKMVRDEYIEFVITEQTSAATLASLTFGDTNDATSQLQGVFRFDQATLEAALAGSSVTEFQAGTIIVVKGVGLGAQNISYNPLSNNLSDTDAWSLQLVAGQGARDHSETLINGNINFGNNGEVVWISASNPPAHNTDTSGFIHAIGYDSSPGVIANRVISTFGSGNIATTSIPTNRVLSNTGGLSASVVVNNVGSFGQTNGGANDTWIIGGLRTTSALNLAPEPARASLLALGCAMLALRRRRTNAGGSHV